MAVDESLFKPKEYVDDEDVFRKRTIGNVLIIFALGVLAVVYFWPHDSPMNSIQFLLTVSGVPLALAAISGMMLLMHRQNHVMDVAFENEAAAQVRDYVMTAAGRPLALLAASAHYGSAPVKELSREVGEKSPAYIRKRGAVHWFEYPEKDLNGTLGCPEFLYKKALMSTIFSKILGDISLSLLALPSAAPCVVHLSIANQMSEDDNVACWKDSLSVHTSRDLAVVYSEHDESGMMSFDTWLDHAIQRENEEIRLIVSVQLLPSEAEPLPSGGSTEAAAALLLVPHAVALRFGLQREAELFRPVKGTFTAHAKSLALALTFAGVEGQDIKENRSVGISAGQRGWLTMAENSQDVSATAIDLDAAVGVAGIAAPWFAIASAHASLLRGGGPQMITTGREDDVCTMVMTPVQKRGLSASHG